MSRAAAEEGVSRGFGGDGNDHGDEDGEGGDGTWWCVWRRCAGVWCDGNICKRYGKHVVGVARAQGPLHRPDFRKMIFRTARYL